MTDNPAYLTPLVAHHFALTIAQAVALSGCSRTAVYNALKDQTLSGVKCGRRTLILTSELQRYLAELPAYKPTA